jgi:thiol-disulfide isomerase/thioredoxin
MFRTVALLLALALPSAAQISLSAKGLNGAPDSLENYRGKVVVLNFWATWCVPCTDEMKLLTAAHNDYANKAVAVITASLDEAKDRKSVYKFIKKQKMTMPVWLDITPAQSEKLTGSPGLPVTLFIDRDGKLISRIVGQLRPEELKERIEWLLSDRSSAAPAADVDHIRSSAASQ